MPEEISNQYGLFDSPMTPKALSQSLRLTDTAWDSDGATLLWLEGRGERGVLVCSKLDGDCPRDLSDELSVRAGVGYGGGDFCAGNGNVFFISGGRLYRQPIQGGRSRALTPAFGEAASPAVSPDGRWVLYVFSYERKDGLAIVDAEGTLWPQIVASGHDFFMQPRWSPDGRRAAWISWNHPQMPWDGTRLFIADVSEQIHPDELRMRQRGLKTAQKVPPVFENEQALAGGQDTALFQPEFSPDGKYLSYLSDQTGWHNLYLYDLARKTLRMLTHEKCTQLGAPAWAQGQRTYGWSHDSKSLHCIRNERGVSKMFAYEVASGKGAEVSGFEGMTDFLQPALNPKRNVLAVIASGSRQPSRIVIIEPVHSPGSATVPVAGGTRSVDSRRDVGAPKGTERVLINEPGSQRSMGIVKRSSCENVPPEALIPAQPISWKSEKRESIFGLVYLPPDIHMRQTSKIVEQSSKIVGQTFLSASGQARMPAPPRKERPPAIIHIHGGPTGQSRAAYRADLQFFATRGYTVLDVNYRGSTGYGRKYMESLRGEWGVYDVEDAISGAKYLLERGWADKDRLVIMGGSAGGFTVLQSLVKHPGFFKAGVCCYGVSNMFALATDTHKFEERYLDSMLGALPEASALYRDRSPIFHADNIVDPVAVFQGDIDKVVPRAQSDTIVESLRKRGVPHEYHVYEGEGHGWRKQQTIESYFKAVEAFLRQYVLFA